MNTNIASPLANLFCPDFAHAWNVNPLCRTEAPITPESTVSEMRAPLIDSFPSTATPTFSGLRSQTDLETQSVMTRPEDSVPVPAEWNASDMLSVGLCLAALLGLAALQKRAAPLARNAVLRDLAEARQLAAKAETSPLSEADRAQASLLIRSLRISTEALNMPAEREQTRELAKVFKI